MDPLRLQALEAVVRAAKAMKQAKKRGIDVKPYKPRVKEAGRRFRDRDYQGTIDVAERIIADVTGVSQPLG